ncbi:type I-E CRISPR-associated endonuclease Cas1e [Collinsella tanakaei]|uniref:type I-E CRISPR-associated endonuclease Cas1e n=1 Tax=Collinsella tanakaei TaxID=626935 RepID=UPI00195B4FDB|nr:type I-E CRISPR-associated endonuclease Cas1e [Collinsella tanakaei]MBM6868148.1 type I-E CRISPR-associated endonuclease Cas1 [Collinsella tanakaei]
MNELGSESKGGSALPSASPVDVMDLTRSSDRLSFLYFDRCRINQEDNALTIIDDEGTIRVPTASLSVLMLGPGTSITHKAMVTIGESGATVVWVGERGVRMYAAGRPLTHSSSLLQIQAKLVSNTRTRLRVARAMYGMRFPGEDVSALTMQQLRGKEGARVRKVYQRLAKETGVSWNRREYNPDDFDDASDINMALSAAHACLYGVVHAAIVALGCSPGLGFVHTGHERSFVYDIADLYKAELSIPVAFKVAADHPVDIGQVVRREMRDAMYDLPILDRVVSDIKYLFTVEENDDPGLNHVGIWDERVGEVPAGRLYGEVDDGGRQ